MPCIPSGLRDGWFFVADPAVETAGCMLGPLRGGRGNGSLGLRPLRGRYAIFLLGNRWCAARPPANGWDPCGMREARREPRGREVPGWTLGTR